jgi:tetratricopeptide (TPR) repeat protein
MTTTYAAAMLLALLLAAAASTDESAEAKVHFQAGSTHYQLKQYSEAIREFAAGYALSPRPEFLINLGQAYRGAGDLPQALNMFKQYLEKAPANAKPRAQVEQLVRQLEQQIKDEAEQKPPAKPADAPLKEEAAPTLVPIASAPEAVAAPAQESHTSPLVWIIPVAAAVVVAAGVAVAVALSNSGPSCSGAGSLGCVDLRKQ